MMALRRPALLGAGEGSCGPPTGSAGSCACYIDGTRAQGVCGGRVGGAGALPSQRDSGRSDPVRRRRRRALPRPWGGAHGAAAALRASEDGGRYGEGGRQWRVRAGWELGAFRRHPWTLSLILLCCAEIARCFARRRFSRPPPETSTQAARHLSGVHGPANSGGCVPLSVRCTRTPARHYPPFVWLLAIARHRSPAAF